MTTSLGPWDEEVSLCEERVAHHAQVLERRVLDARSSILISDYMLEAATQSLAWAQTRRQQEEEGEHR